MRAVLTPTAKRDFVLATAAILEGGSRAANGFVDAVEEAAARLGRYPEIGAERRELADPPVRFWSLSRYSYVMIYNSAAVPPKVLRIVHSARDLPELLSGLRSE